MNLRALQLFRHIVLTGALSEASDRLNISVSAASRLLSQLESDVGLTLFSRKRRRLELTEQGQLFFRQIANTLIGIDEIPKVADDIRGRAQEWLSIVTAAPVANGLVVPALARLSAAMPRLQCTVNVESRFDIESKVSVRGYNLGVISLPVENAIIDLQIVQFLRSRLCVLLVDSHPLAGRDTIRAEDLAGETFVSLAPGQRWRERLDELMGRAGLPYTVAFETGSTVVTVEMVRAGLGITLIDRVCAPPVLGNGLVMRPIEGAHWITYASLHPPGPHAPLAELFLDALSDHVEALRVAEPRARDLLELI
ncbi:LysR family transcriptional regulator [Puniceibacterium sediminis]|uniref:DNA-binding transcriptional regulator, LysR family n=1 Tax=Puniceibacterium sediminis TaxID=1608407 RepID=A0A238YFZ9_9RHOB|nr:LysR family transcriptional regulator [Puniceibacterium sediminis]SNR69718.1 DNA-binding transcriptional regulator, LysR family [Puniceibacterium sediminis]